MFSRAEQDALKARILANPESAIKSNFMSHVARVDQISGGYNPDVWEMTVLHKGAVVYGGLPGQSAYYTDELAGLNSHFEKETLFQSLQVRPSAEFGYRTALGKYIVTRDIRIPFGDVNANPSLGPGMARQYFIANFEHNLSLVEKLELRSVNDYELSSNRPGY